MLSQTRFSNRTRKNGISKSNGKNKTVSNNSSSNKNTEKKVEKILKPINNILGKEWKPACNKKLKDIIDKEHIKFVNDFIDDFHNFIINIKNTLNDKFIDVIKNVNEKHSLTKPVYNKLIKDMKDIKKHNCKKPELKENIIALLTILNNNNKISKKSSQMKGGVHSDDEDDEDDNEDEHRDRRRRRARELEIYDPNKTTIYRSSRRYLTFPNIASFLLVATFLILSIIISLQMLEQINLLVNLLLGTNNIDGLRQVNNNAEFVQEVTNNLQQDRSINLFRRIMNLFDVVFRVARSNHLNNVLTALSRIAQRTTETVVNVCSGSLSGIDTTSGKTKSIISSWFGAKVIQKIECISNTAEIEHDYNTAIAIRNVRLLQEMFKSSINEIDGLYNSLCSIFNKAIAGVLLLQGFNWKRELLMGIGVNFNNERGSRQHRIDNSRSRRSRSPSLAIGYASAASSTDPNFGRVLFNGRLSDAEINRRREAERERIAEIHREQARRRRNEEPTRKMTPKEKDDYDRENGF